MTDFRMLKVFNDEGLRPYANSDVQVGDRFGAFFTEDTLQDRLLREFVIEHALPSKEITEAFEFFAVCRKYLRKNASLVDLCSGHGLAGLLFAIFERRVERVLLCDKKEPRDHARVMNAVLRVAPWVESKVEFVEGKIADRREAFPKGSAVLGVHACGKLTDECIDVALDLAGDLAVLPCCRSKALNTAPEGLRQALGEDVAYDVERTYRMERAGYRVRWREIPEAITPMNRVLIGTRRAVKSR